jgi:sugar phosphate isomerase/epimerase
MSRKVTMFTGQWADLPLDELAAKAAKWGYDGLELACWGDHFDVKRGAESKTYCDEQRARLARHGLDVRAISNHLAGQLICDPNFDARSDAFAPAALAGDAEGKRKWAVEQMKDAARAARNLGIGVVNGFTGSPIWHMIYSFPPVSKEMVADGYRYFAKQFNPILDVFAECGVKFALEVHPTEIAFDLVTAERTLDAIGRRPEFGFNFDPSHLYWQRVDPVKFIDAFADRIYHVHIKDAALELDGTTGILGSHLDFDEPRRGWNFRSPGHGQIDFELIIRALNRARYTGPLSVEWEDCGMDREYGAADACRFVRRIDFAPSNLQFDAAMKNRS